MPPHQPLTAVVIDIGHAYTKVGFASESAPRAIIPTVLKVRGKEEPILPDPWNYGNAILTLDKKQLIVRFKSFFEHIYFKFLQVNPKSRRVIICESLTCPTVIRESIAEVLLLNFNVPSVLFALHHLLASCTVAAKTALVLDCSETESAALPIIEGTPIIWAWHSASLAGCAIHQQIQAFIRADGSIQTLNGNPVSLKEDLPIDIIEDIKVKACFVAGYERAKKIQAHKLAQWEVAKGREERAEDQASCRRPDPPPDMVYPMNGNQMLLIPGKVREEAPEILFEMDGDRLSVSTLVLDSIMKCPIDSRKFLASNLLVAGGTSMLPGFSHRLLSELEDLIVQEERYKPLSECKFRIHNPPVPANIVSWLGASIYASLETFPYKSITKEYFTENKNRLPDWCVLDLQTPEFQPDRSTISSSRKSLPYLGKTGLKTSSRLSLGSISRTSTTSAALASLKQAQVEKAAPEKK